MGFAGGPGPSLSLGHSGLNVPGLGFWDHPCEFADQDGPQFWHQSLILELCVSTARALDHEWKGRPQPLSPCKGCGLIGCRPAARRELVHKEGTAAVFRLTLRERTRRLAVLGNGACQRWEGMAGDGVQGGRGVSARLGDSASCSVLARSRR